MNILIFIVYNLTILIGTCYLIINYHWSMWWMVLAVLLLTTGKTVK